MLKLGIFQPDLRHYRVPVYNMLGAQPDIALSVFAPKVYEGIEEKGGVESFTFQQVSEQAYRGGFFNQPAMHQLLHPERFDLVIFPWNTGYISSWKGVRRAKKLGIKSALWGHGYSKKPGGGFKHWLRCKMGKYADATLLYSQTVADSLIAMNGFNPSRTFVAPNALDHGQVRGLFRASAINADALLAFATEKNIDPKYTMIFVSRLCEDNRIEMLVQAMPHILSQCPHAHLVIVGDGEMMIPLREKIYQMALDRCIHMPGAIYNETELSRWMMNARLFVYPTNIGLSLHKAFGYGLPVVTDDNISAHNPEIEALQDGVNGMLYKAGDVYSLANACLRILQNDELQSQMSKQAVRQAYDVYTIPNMVQGFLNLCEMVDGKKREVVGEANVAC